MDHDVKEGLHEQPASGAPASITLSYERAEDLRRDQLRDATIGLIARVASRLRRGDGVDVRIEITGQRLSVSARGLVRWATPLARGSLVGLDLEGVGHRDRVKLDLLFGIRAAGRPGEADEEPSEARSLSVAMLQPNGVLRQVLQHALERFASEKAGGAALRLESSGDAESFVASVAARRPDLAIIDCDGMADTAEPILEAVRLHESARRTPVILLSSIRSPGLEDRYTVTMRKPLAMKAFLQTTDILLRA